MWVGYREAPFVNASICVHSFRRYWSWPGAQDRRAWLGDRHLLKHCPYMSMIYQKSIHKHMSIVEKRDAPALEPLFLWWLIWGSSFS